MNEVPGNEERDGALADSNSVVAQRSGSLRKMVRIWAIAQTASLFLGIFFMQIFAGAGFIGTVYARGRRRIATPYYHRALWAFVGTVSVMLLSSLLSENPLDSIHWLVKHFAMPLVLFTAALMLLRSRKIRQIVLTTLLFGGALSGLYGLFQHVTGLDPIYGQRIKPLTAYGLDLFMPVGLLDMALTYAGVQMTVLLAVMPSVWQKRGKGAWLWWLSALLIALSIFFTYRRGPILAVAAVLGVWLLLRNRRVAIVTVIAGILLAATAWFGSSAFRQGMRQVVELKGTSVNQRVILWDIAWEMGSDFPLLGVGPGLWRRNVPNYVEDDTPTPGRPFAHAHSDPLQLWATTGLAGVVSVGALNLMLLLYGFRELRRTRDQVGSKDRLLYAGGLLALAGMVLASFSQCYMLDAENMFAHGFVLALMLNAREGLLRDDADGLAESL